ncbi:4-diphosphocytidyl-2C-methyl-D-erythritol kinase [Puia dinghuensis]|uniref:4-diphosphocytidyl-2C-methyl-D-erythritol kinase n=2 Tax=Puia dinghuensis TaxID=1792502 RepID=A0A8J2XRV4_9BACT|nr:4-diphosphocytidyl-2C-methyl-D-erythritol kinase [Puia dinghuensis]
MVTAILLAAGSSKRMGACNKLLLPWQGKTVLSSTTERLLAAGIEEIILVTGHEAPAIEATVANLPVYIIHNPHHATGMTSSIQAGIRIAHGQGYIICLADMVLITPAEYRLLATAFEEKYSTDPQCIIIPEYQGQKGNPVVFSASWREAILQHSEEEGCRTLVRSHPEHHFYVPMPTGHILKDIDFPEDYQTMIR